jgi:hypothetical protein
VLCQCDNFLVHRAAGTVDYTLDAIATTCTPSHLETSQTSSNAPLAVSPGTSVTALTLAFTGCQ